MPNTEYYNGMCIIKKIKHDKFDFVITAGLTHVGGLLYNYLWSKVYVGILTSATLSVNKQFDYYLHKLGLKLSKQVSGIVLNSCFDYAKQAQIVVPRFKNAPVYATRNEFRDELQHYLASTLDYEDSYGTLVLFFNRDEQQQVYDSLPSNLQQIIQLQEFGVSRDVILRNHRNRIDNGQPSVIFGLNSFAEGVDLPSKYCMHVIVTKLPFETYKDPYHMVQEYWYKYEKANYFMDVAIPEACIKLIQAVGRLIRSEQDYGQVTICDNRLVTKQYGGILLNSLPNFNRKYDKDFIQKVLNYF